MNSFSKKILLGIALAAAIFPFAAFAQALYQGSSEPSTFQAASPQNGQPAASSQNSFQLVPCNAAPVVDANGALIPSGLSTDTQTPCDFLALMQLVQRFINLLLYAMIFIAVIMILWAGYNYLTAGGDTGKIKKAHDIFRVTVIGMIIALTSWVIVNTVVTSVIDANFGGGSALNLLQKQ